jgi:hypothetical protein
MFTHLTGQARRVLQLAHQEAFERNHDYLGTEHLLVAMLREGAGAAARVLEACHIDPSELLDALEDGLVPSRRVLTLEKLPLTLAVQRVLERAEDDARQSHRGQACVEHLLLALLEEEESQAAQLLLSHGLTSARCREQLAGKPPAENRDHLVQAEIPARPGGGRDPSARDLEDWITPEVLPREWHPGQTQGFSLVNVQAVENQLRGTQLVLGAVLGAFAMVDMYGWKGIFAGAMLGILAAAFQNSLLGGLFGGLAGFFVGLQYHHLGAWVVICTTLAGVFLGTWLGNAWRVAPPPAPPAPPE